ncbi:MAG: hypothetical protein C0478_14985 [Planctomyces sp.]|nr:hypothetical protein [Planctomyces sp.]
MPVTKRRISSINLALVIVLLAVNGFVSSVNIGRLFEAQRDVTHTFEVLRKLGNLQEEIVSFESSARGFVITKDPAYLASGIKALEDLPGTYGDLFTDLLDNPEQTRKLVELGPLIAERLEVASLALKVFSESGESELMKIARTGRAKQRMDEIRFRVSDMLESERELLKSRSAGVEFNYYVALMTTLLAVFISTGVAIGAWRSIDRELAARIAAEHSARLTSENFRVTIHSVADGLVTTDARGRITLLNDVAKNLIQAGEEVIGKPVDEIFQIARDATSTSDEHPVHHVLRTGQRLSAGETNWLIRADGTRVAIDDRASPIRSVSGRLQGTVLVFRDISEKLTTAQALRRRDERFRRAFDSSLVGMALCNKDGLIVDANETYLETIGYSRQGFHDADLSWGDITPPQFSGLDSGAWEELRATGRCRPFEKEFITRSGSRVPVLIAATKLHDDEESEVAIYTVNLSQLRAAEQRYRMLTNASPQIVWIARPGEGNLYCNDRWYEYTGLTTEETRGMGWLRAVPADHQERVAKEWSFAAIQPETCEIELPLRGRDGEYRWHLLRGVPQINADGEVVELIGTMTDIDALRVAQQELQIAHRRKDLFLATLSHELRNPMTPISNAIEAWRASNLSPEELTDIREMLGRQIQQMVRLIDDLLDVSRITGGKIQLRPSVLDARSCIQSAVEASAPLVRQAGHELTIDLPQEPVWVKADATRLVQIVGNLLNNAAKYTDAGGRIRLRMFTLDHQVKIQIADNGAGIPPHMLEQVFGMFEQVGTSLDRAQGGLGIGLTLVRSLAELHGGTVKAASEGLGKGSTFTVTLPRVPAPVESDTPVPPSAASSQAGDMAPPVNVTSPARPLAADATQAPEGEASGSGIRVMIVDDVAASARTLAMMLRAIGQPADVCFDGREAIDLITADPPDIVFLDIAMPGMDGYEVARRIRAKCPRKPVLVALTGFGQPDDRKQSQAAGFNLHLTKPTSLDALRTLLTHYGHPSATDVEHPHSHVDLEETTEEIHFTPELEDPNAVPLLGGEPAYKDPEDPSPTEIGRSDWHSTTRPNGDRPRANKPSDTVPDGHVGTNGESQVVPSPREDAPE